MSGTYLYINAALQTWLECALLNTCDLTRAALRQIQVPSNKRQNGGLLLLENLGHVVGNFPAAVDTTEILFGCVSKSTPEVATVHGEQRKKEVVSQWEECG